MTSSPALMLALFITVDGACRCRQERFCQKTERADHVFHGVVRVVAALGANVQYDVGVQERFKSAPGTEHRSELTIRSSSTCGWTLEVGDDFLFAADSQFWITSCSATKQWSTLTTPELAALQAGAVCDDCASMKCASHQRCARDGRGTAYCTDACDAGRCAPGESCALVAFTNCDDAIACSDVAVCNPIPLQPSCATNCSTDFQPVCGSDGVTYGNECLLRNAACQQPGLQLARTGQCCKRSCCKFRECRSFAKGEYCTDTCHPERCPKGYHCKLHKPKSCANEPCPDVATCERSCGGQCGQEYLPVCGTDGVTYANRCQLHRAQCSDATLTQLHVGICSGAESMCGRVTQCPELYDPICGSNGVTYANSCYFEAARCTTPRLQLAREEACGATCDLSCPSTGAPVCSNQGVTYGNECLLRQATCRKGNIWIAKTGACDRCP